MRHRDAASGEWATGGAKLLAQATAAQLGMLITTTRWTGPTCCWKTVAMAGEWTAAGTATGRAVLMVPMGAVAMRRRAGGCSWRSRGSREPRDGLGGDSQHPSPELLQNFGVMLIAESDGCAWREWASLINGGHHADWRHGCSPDQLACTGEA